MPKQWYLTQSRFYEPWLTLPALERVPVAIIDSGVDTSHPELEGKILDAKSFVGGSAGIDTLGHGTFVAGISGWNTDVSADSSLISPALIDTFQLATGFSGLRRTLIGGETVWEG